MGLIDRLERANARLDASEAARRVRQWEVSPVGRARAAYLRGDQVFRCELANEGDLGLTGEVVGFDGKTITKTWDVNEVLNAICSEGWRIAEATPLHGGAFERKATTGYVFSRRRS